MYNMKLIADSGSTKTDWALLQGGEVLLRVRTEGLNPNTTSSEKCNEIIAHAIELMAHASDVKHIYFYGAGCAGEEQKKQMTAILHGLFRRQRQRLRAICMALFMQWLHLEKHVLPVYWARARIVAILMGQLLPAMIIALDLF